MVSLDYGSNFDSNKPHELIIFATPNGASHLSEAKLLQKQAADLRAARPGRNVVIAFVAPQGSKWPNYLSSNPTNTTAIHQAIAARVYQGTHSAPESISLDAHSGGGSYIFNYISNSPEIPSTISSFNLYDCLYAYNGLAHAQKIYNWLRKNPSSHLTNITGTPQIAAKQAQLIADLTSLGLSFSTVEDNSTLTTVTALNGRLKFSSLKTFDHNGTVTRDGFLYAHTDGQTPIKDRFV